MGFRSTMVTSCYKFDWPEWFVEKYADYIHFGTCISSKFECKTYGVFMDLVKDIETALPDRIKGNYTLVYLHECGGVTKVDFTKHGAITAIPSGWSRVNNPIDPYDVGHYECYGCSDLSDIAKEDK